jgi:hypothetical protein
VTSLPVALLSSWNCLCHGICERFHYLEVVVGFSALPTVALLRSCDSLFLVFSEIFMFFSSIFFRSPSSSAIFFSSPSTPPSGQNLKYISPSQSLLQGTCFSKFFSRLVSKIKTILLIPQSLLLSNFPLQTLHTISRNKLELFLFICHPHARPPPPF